MFYIDYMVGFAEHHKYHKGTQIHTHTHTKLLCMYVGQKGRSAVMHNASQAVDMMCHEERAARLTARHPTTTHNRNTSLGHAG